MIYHHVHHPLQHGSVGAKAWRIYNASHGVHHGVVDIPQLLGGDAGIFFYGKQVRCWTVFVWHLGTACMNNNNCIAKPCGTGTQQQLAHQPHLYRYIHGYNPMHAQTMRLYASKTRCSVALPARSYSTLHALAMLPYCYCSTAMTNSRQQVCRKHTHGTYSCTVLCFELLGGEVRWSKLVCFTTGVKTGSPPYCWLDYASSKSCGGFSFRRASSIHSLVLSQHPPYLPYQLALAASYISVIQAISTTLVSTTRIVYCRCIDRRQTHTTLPFYPPSPRKQCCQCHS